METYLEMVAMIFMLIRFAIVIMQAERKRITNAETISSYEAIKMIKPVTRRYKMKLNFARRIKNVKALFNVHFIDAKALYVLQFDKIPCVCFIGNVDTKDVFDYIGEKFRAEIVAVYQHSYFDPDKQEILFNDTLFVMTQNRIIEVAPGYVHVLYQPEALAEVKHLMKTLAEFRMATAPTYQTQVVGFARQPGMN